jgi:hypothetical protein
MDVMHLIIERRDPNKGYEPDGIVQIDNQDGHGGTHKAAPRKQKSIIVARCCRC